MKKFSIMFFLILVVALFACKQEEAGEKAGETPTTTPTTKTAQELADEAKKAEDDKKKKDEEAAEKKAREDALTVLKDKIAAYNTKIDTAKKAYDGTTGKKTISIPSGITVVQDSDKDKIYASLGHDNASIGELEEAIKVLGITSSNASSSKAQEAKTAGDLLKMLVDLENNTKKILNDHLKGDKLAKIEKDKNKIDTATAELDKFIASRDEFIKSAKTLIKAADAAKSTASEAKKELDKITGAVGSTTPKTGESGYGDAMVKAIEANEKALGDLVK